MRRGLEGYRVTAGELERPLWLAMIADAYRTFGAMEDGLSSVAEALALVNATGIRFEEAELHRLQGEILVASGGDPAQAERAFRRALEVAAGQKARALELRAGINLAGLWLSGAKREAARRTLSEVYEWFSEGLDTPDLREAYTRLEQLV